MTNESSFYDEAMIKKCVPSTGTITQKKLASLQNNISKRKNLSFVAAYLYKFFSFV